MREIVVKKRNKLEKFFFKFLLAIEIAFRHRHGTAIYLSENQLKQLIVDGTFTGTVKYAYWGLMEHQAQQTIITVSKLFNEVDIICAKAEFEIYVDEKIQGAKPSSKPNNC